MARARSIKPGFFKNEQLAELPHPARLLFAGLWTIADRAGRLEDRPKRIKAEIFPYENQPVDRLLESLNKAGFIVRYESGGNHFISIPTWGKHQNPHIKEAASTIPAPCEHCADAGNSGTSPADSLNPEPLTLNPEPDLPEPHANPVADGTEAFQQFRGAWESIGKPVSEAEWRQVLHYWISENLDLSIAVIMPELRGYYKAKRDAIRDRDWEHVMFPLNWLKRRPWERKIAAPQRQAKPPTCSKCSDTGMVFDEMKPGMSDAEWLETGRPCECGHKSKGEAA